MPVLYPMIEFTPVAVLQNKITQASRKGIKYLRRSSESRACCPAAARAACAVAAISSNSSVACPALRDLSSAA